MLTIDGFQMSIKHPTSERQEYNQEAKWAFYLKRIKQPLSVLMVRTQRSGYYSALNTDPDSCPPEVKPHPMKTMYMRLSTTYSIPVYGQHHTWKCQAKSYRSLIHHMGLTFDHVLTSRPVGIVTIYTWKCRTLAVVPYVASQSIVIWWPL